MTQISLELKRRILTGFIGGIVLIALILYGQRPGIYLLTLILSVGMLYEFTSIVFTLQDKKQKHFILLAIASAYTSIHFMLPAPEFIYLITVFLCLFFYYLLAAQRHAEKDLLLHFRELMYSVFGLVYLVFIPFFLPRIFDCSNGAQWTLLFFLINWAGDVGAYFVGKRFGRHKLYPAVSPKKTWEGSLGGLFCGWLVSIIFKELGSSALASYSVLCVSTIAVLVGVSAQAGDLCESLLKRAFDKKDSGSILPGHGGFLDRFDGVVFSLPVMYACIRFFS